MVALIAVCIVCGALVITIKFCNHRPIACWTDVCNFLCTWCGGCHAAPGWEDERRPYHTAAQQRSEAQARAVVVRELQHPRPGSAGSGPLNWPQQLSMARVGQHEQTEMAAEVARRLQESVVAAQRLEEALEAARRLEASHRPPPGAGAV